MFFLIFIVLVILLYLYLIMPRLTGRPDYTPFSGWYYAHRGLHDNAAGIPENSLPAFRLAAEHGYGIELDIQLTKDQIPVIFHDDTLARVCGQPGYIWDYTYKELQAFSLFNSNEHIPHLQDALQIIDGRVPLIIEFKMHNSDPQVCRIADPFLQAYSGLYCIESFYPFAVQWYRKNHPHIVRGQLSANFTTADHRESFLQWTVHMLLTNVSCRPDFIAYSSADTGNLSRVLCRKLFHALSVAWTIRSEEELQLRKKDYDLFIFEDFRPAAK